MCGACVQCSVVLFVTCVPLPVVLYYCGTGNSQRAEAMPESPLCPVLSLLLSDFNSSSLGWELFIAS